MKIAELVLTILSNRFIK